ncbi:Hypothetical predicted protein, partial [Mytilus galloprovincialis]
MASQDSIASHLSTTTIIPLDLVDDRDLDFLDEITIVNDLYFGKAESENPEIQIYYYVCWVPIQFTILYAEYRPEKQLQLEQWYTQLSFFAHVLAFANSSINPMIYAGFNDNFKKGFKQMFGLYKKRYTSVSRLDDSSTTVVTSLSKGRIFKEESSFTLN